MSFKITPQKVLGIALILLAIFLYFIIPNSFYEGSQLYMGVFIAIVGIPLIAGIGFVSGYLKWK